MTTPFDFEQARFNMIEQQIRPWDVLDLDVLGLLSIVKRENYVQPCQQTLAFVDVELPLTERAVGPCMFPPRVEARLLQELQLKAHEQALEIGTGSGYMAALLAHTGHKVTTVEIDSALAARAQQVLAQNGVANVTVIEGNGFTQTPATPSGGWDAIVLSGGVASVPDSLLKMLKVGGRLIAIVGRLPAMQAQVITRTSQQTWETKTVFETAAPLLVGAPRATEFTF